MKSFGAFAPRQLQIMGLLEDAFPFPLPIEVIALEVGISRQHCANLLAQMRQQGRVEYLGLYHFGSVKQGEGSFALYGAVIDG